MKAHVKTNITPTSLLAHLAKAVAIAMLGCACDTSLGIPNGVLDGGSSNAFNGISGVTVLSPNTAQVTWNASSRYSPYKVYSAGATAPLATSLFSSATLTGLSPATSYTLSVAGTPTASAGSSQIFGGDLTMTAVTWPNFTGATRATALSASAISVSWNFPYVGPTYNIYVNQGSAPTDFTTPDLTTQALSGIVTTWGGTHALAQAGTYYVVVRATYLDASSENNLNALIVNTPSAINPFPTISAPSVSIGGTPTIVVSGALPGYQTTFTVGGTILGNVSGNGQLAIPTSKALSTGTNTISVSVAYQGYTAQLPNLTIVSRQLSSIYNDAPLMTTGGGRQWLGEALAVGDFNCDGADDLAVSASLGTFFTTGNYGNVAQQGLSNGGVYVFYGGGTQGLILPGQTLSGQTVPNPSTSPTGLNPLFIPYPTSIPSQIYYNYYALGYQGSLFGHSLAAGNINGDTRTISGNINACDDLAIGAPGYFNPGFGYASGTVFVFYGSPTGLQLGNPSINSQACSGSVCTPQQILPMAVSGDPTLTGYSTMGFGQALAFGNFNGNASGYHGLAVSAPGYSGDTFNGAQNSALHPNGNVYIYAGDATGIKFGAATSGYAAATLHAPANVVTPLSPYVPTPVLGSFGQAMAAVDIDADGYDDLFIGSPQDSETIGGTTYIYRGSVYYYHNTHAVGVGLANGAAATKQLQNGYAGSMLYPGVKDVTLWGGTIAAAGDTNYDGYPDVIVGSGLGHNTWGAQYQFPIIAAIYGSASGPQGFNAATPSQPTAPAINALACNAGCSGAGGTATCATCSVQLLVGGGQGTYGGLNWLDLWNYYYTSYFGPSVGGAKTANNVGLGYLAFGGQTFNNDNYADILIGNPAGGNNFSGTINALYGSKNGLGTTPTILNPSQSFPNDGTGFSVAAGVFKVIPTCPTIASVASGSPNSSTQNAGAFGGAAYIFSPVAGGGNCSLPAFSSNPNQIIKTNLSGETTANNALYASTTAVPAGDINNDGYTDLAVTLWMPAQYPGASANFHDNLPKANIQIAIIYYGSASGMSFSSATPSLNPVGNQPLLLAPPTTSGCGGLGQITCYDAYAFGGSVGELFPAGDVNGDGFSDLVGFSGNSWVNLYYGSASGLQVLNFPSPTATGLDAKSYGAALSGAAGPYSLPYTFGDFNGDGYSDIAFSYNYYTGPPNNVTYQGEVTVLYGSKNGFQVPDQLKSTCTGTYNSSGTKTWPSNGATTFMCSTNTALANPCDGNATNSCVEQMLMPPPAEDIYSYFGMSIAAVGDVNGDQFDDLLVTAPEDSTFSGFSIGGVAYLYFGSSRGLVVGANGYNVVQTPSNPPAYSPAMINPSAAYAGRYLGYGYHGSSSAGDVNHDGFADFIMGTYASGAYLFYGCKPNSPGCSNTGVYGLNYNTGSNTFTVAPLTGGCTPGNNCTVNAAPSCLSGGACSPLYFAPASSGAGDDNYSYTPYWGSVVGTVGDLNGDGYSEILLGGGYPTAGNGPPGTSNDGYKIWDYYPGHAILYSGSPTGLVVGTPSHTPQCVPGQGCQPYWLSPPNIASWGSIGTPMIESLSYTQRLIGYSGRKPVDFNGDGQADFVLNYNSAWNSNHTAYGQGGVIFFQ